MSRGVNSSFGNVPPHPEEVKLTQAARAGSHWCPSRSHARSAMRWTERPLRGAGHSTSAFISAAMSRARCASSTSEWTLSSAFALSSASRRETTVTLNGASAADARGSTKRRSSAATKSVKPPVGDG